MLINWTFPSSIGEEKKRKGMLSLFVFLIDEHCQHCFHCCGIFGNIVGGVVESPTGSVFSIALSSLRHCVNDKRRRPSLGNRKYTHKTSFITIRRAIHNAASLIATPNYSFYNMSEMSNCFLMSANQSIHKN